MLAGVEVVGEATMKSSRQMAQVGWARGEEWKKGWVEGGMGWIAEIEGSPPVEDFSSMLLWAVLEGEDRLGRAVPYG
jgi:hypothetical protein